MAHGLDRRKLPHKQPPGSQGIFRYQPGTRGASSGPWRPGKTQFSTKSLELSASLCLAALFPSYDISQRRQKPVLPRLPRTAIRRQQACRTLSGVPTASVATTGKRLAKASRMLLPGPSVWEVIKKRSVSGRISEMSRWNPGGASPNLSARLIGFDHPALLPLSDEDKHCLTSRVQNLFSGTPKSQVVLLVAECRNI